MNTARRNAPIKEVIFFLNIIPK